MKNPFKQSEESSFEQGISVVKPVKAVSDAARQQSKNVTSDIVAQLYGVSDSSSGNGIVDNTQASKQAQSSSASVAQQSSKFPGIQTPEEMARYQALQSQLRGQGKSDEEVKAQSTHSQNYFRPTIGTVEDAIHMEKRNREQKEQERRKQYQQEEQEQQQTLKENNEELPQATGKGRNRMGKKAKTSIALKMSTQKTETFRGASG